MQLWNQIRSMKTGSRQTDYMLKTNTASLCKCEIERKISFILKLQFNLEKIAVTNEVLKQIRGKLMKDFVDSVEHGRSSFRNMKTNCNHEYNTLHNDIKNLLDDRNNSKDTS